MSSKGQIIGLGPWLQTPSGRYAAEWEAAHWSAEVADAFGFHAVQLGAADILALDSNRMPHRWLAHDQGPLPSLPNAGAADSIGAPQASATPSRAADLHCHFDALPFEAASMDLVVLPHTLEFAPDPHSTLAEVARVLRPEGRVALTGFNPHSLWRLQQRLGRFPRLGSAERDGLRAAELLAPKRVRDWLLLLGFEIERAGFACWRPLASSDRRLKRWAHFDRLGPKGWPMLGGLYHLSAVKRVPGVRAIQKWKPERVTAPAVATVVPTPLWPHGNGQAHGAEARADAPVHRNPD